MAHVGMLRDYRFEDREMNDIRGANIYGPDDEKLGEIDDVIFDHSTGDIKYLVVDTGGWLSSKKFVVPANRVSPYHNDENDFYSDLSKERVEMFPAYDEKLVEAEERWTDYETRYQKAWDESPVLHQEGTTNIVTPPASEMPPAAAGTARPESTAHLTPKRIRDKFDMPKAPQTTPRPMESTQTGVPSPQAHPATGRLWDFQERLRNDRARWAETCPECKRKAA